MTKQKLYRRNNYRIGLSYLRIQERSSKHYNGSVLDNISKYKDLFNIFIQLSIATGAVITFIYCFFYINYIPYGLGFGDSINYIFISLGFGALYSLFVLIHAMPALLWVKPNKEEKRDCFLLFLGCVFFIVIICFYWNFSDGFLYIVLSILYVVCIFIFVSHGWRNESISINIRVFFALFLFITPLFIQGVFSFMLDKTLTRLNIKSNHSSIQLNDEDFSFLNKLSIEQGVLLKTSCNIFDKNKIIHDVNILWSIGKESLIEIKNEESIRLSLNNDSIKVIKITNPQKCIFKEFRGLFKEGFSILEDNKIKKEIKKFIEPYKNRIDELVVYGISDLKSNKKYGGNKKLSEDRAYSIKNLLEGIENVRYEGLANFEYSTYCKNKGLDSLDLKDCEAINRGIILKLKLTGQEELEKQKG